MEILLIFATPYFPRIGVIFSSVANTNSLLLIISLGSIEFLMRVGSAFRRILFSACLWLSTLTSKLPFLVFFTVFGVALVEITFSMRKDENLVRQTSSKDSITRNLGKSSAPLSEFDSDKFRLFFFKFQNALDSVYFSLALRSTTHHGIQLLLGTNLGGNPFALVETGIRDQYTRVEGRFSSRCQFQVLGTGQIPIL